MDLWRRYGDAVRYRMGPKMAHMYVRPEHAKRMLVENRSNYIKGPSYDRLRLFMGDGILMSEGSTWRARRRHMNPYFKRSVAESWTDIMVETTAAHLDAVARSEGNAVDIERALIRITMDILVRTLFGVDPVDEPAKLGDALAYCLNYGAINALNPLTPPLFVPTRENRLFLEHRATIDHHIERLMQQRRRRGAAQDDLAGALIFGHDEHRPLPVQAVRDEFLNIFLAGYETTTMTTVWALTYLSRYPEIQRRLQREVDAVLGGRPPAQGDVHTLRYARQVFMETMRLRPVVPLTVRDVVERDMVGDHPVDAGDVVVIGAIITHHHPEFWPNPEAFVPERFSPEESKGRHSCAHYPFHAGERACGGKHMALLEGLLVLAMIAQRFDVELVPGCDLTPEQRGTLRPRQRAHARFRHRRPSQAAVAAVV
jgi:cytochrome P450